MGPEEDRETVRRERQQERAQFAKAFRRYQGQAPSAFRSSGPDAGRDLAHAA